MAKIDHGKLNNKQRALPWKQGSTSVESNNTSKTRKARRSKKATRSRFNIYNESLIEILRKCFDKKEQLSKSDNNFINKIIKRFERHGSTTRISDAQHQKIIGIAVSAGLIDECFEIQ